MITWKRTDYGFHFTLSNPITLDESEKWKEEVEQAVVQLHEDFHVFVDMRNCELVPVGSKPNLEEGQTFCKNNGMVRSVIILGDQMTVMQMKIMAKKTGIYQWERYIDASHNPEWERIGMDWILHAIDPDVAQTPDQLSLKPGN